MIFADIRNGILESVREGCPLAPARCLSCSRPIQPDAKSPCACGEACNPDGGCALAHPHYDPSPGSERVELARLPLEGEAGPFGYDRASGAPIPNPAATAAARTTKEAREGARAKLAALGFTNEEIQALNL